MYLSCQTTHNQLLGNLWIVILIFPFLRGNYPGLPLFAHQTRALRLISYEANFPACSHCLTVQYFYSAQQIHSPVIKSQLSPTVRTLNTDDFFFLQRHHLDVRDILPLHRTFSCHRWTIHLRQHHLLSTHKSTRPPGYGYYSFFLTNKCPNGSRLSKYYDIFLTLRYSLYIKSSSSLENWELCWKNVPF